MALFSIFKPKKKIEHTPDYQAYLSFFDKKTDLKMPVREARFVVLDTETTGLDVKKDRILSIAAVEVQNFSFNVKTRMECYLKQSDYQPGESIAVHGISKQKTATGMDKTVALKDLLQFFRNDIIVGHHIGFDISILNQTLKRKMNGKLLNKVLDTSVLAKRIDDPSGMHHYQAKDYSLDVLCKKYGIEMGERHTAAGDVFITALLFLKQLAILEKRGVKKVGELLK
jgi:DNA polymerase-3 subunit epsilon